MGNKGSLEEEELNQCSYIEDADTKAKCEESIKNEVETHKDSINIKKQEKKEEEEEVTQDTTSETTTISATIQTPLVVNNKGSLEEEELNQCSYIEDADTKAKC